MSSPQPLFKNVVNLKWSIHGIPSEQHEILSPTLLQIDSALDQIHRFCGSVSLIVPNDELTVRKELNVIYGNGVSLVTLLEDCGPEFEHIVRSYFSPQYGTEKIEALGDYWATNELCFDFLIVRQMFHDFLENGDISTEIMN